MLARAMVAALGFVLITNGAADAAPSKSRQNLTVAAQQKNFKTKRVSKAAVKSKTRAAKAVTTRGASRKAVASRAPSTRKTIRLQLTQRITTPKVTPASSSKASLAQLPDTNPVDTAAGRDRYLSLAANVKPSGLPITLVDAVITRESRYNPKARGSSGEVGLMQILPSTGRQLAREHGFDNVARMSHSELVAWLEVPENNIKLGTRYLNMCHERAKRSVPATIGCYNAGPGNMWAWNSISLTRKYVHFVNQHIASN